MQLRWEQKEGGEGGERTGKARGGPWSDTRDDMREARESQRLPGRHSTFNLAAWEGGRGRSQERERERSKGGTRTKAHVTNHTHRLLLSTMAVIFVQISSPLN